MPRDFDGHVMPVTPRVNTESVISQYHPANNRGHAEGQGSYTFRQRNTKLNLTLGWELEANRAPSKVPVGIEHISDGSVDDDGSEFIVLPAITKSPRYVLGLLKDLVHAPRLNTNESCGFHVHVSASNLSSIARMRQWAVATEYLAKQIEDLAFKAVPDSRKDNQYCRRIVPITNGTSFDGHKYNNTRRYHWLNTVEMFRPGGIRTIEVRLLGHTHRWKYVLAWSLFSMELAKRGWDIANRPFEMTGHVDALGKLLTNIAKDIKPLEKKLDPIPQWVYDGLSTFGMESNTWDRPLAQISEVESNLRGRFIEPYTDNQPIIESSNDDDDYCPCGCGDEGRCNTQLHEDGDCDSNECAGCHENDGCGQRCYYCRSNAHENDENCGQRYCGSCNPTPRVRPVTVAPVTHTSNVTVNMTVDNTVMNSARMYDVQLYGAPIATVYIDEAAQVVPPSIHDENIAMQYLSNAEAVASERRENNRGGI